MLPTLLKYPDFNLYYILLNFVYILVSITLHLLKNIPLEWLHRSSHHSTVSGRQVSAEFYISDKIMEANPAFTCISPRRHLAVFSNPDRDEMRYGVVWLMGHWSSVQTRQ